ncbi:hypothetical protein HDU82_005259 [Entophlyctis luteolus]|nr:hypothetical protein HDU82_005259 [Entophlyctis luteolus]
MDKIANESTSELPASGRAVSPPQGAAVAPYPARTIDSTPRHLSEVSRNPEAEIHDQSRSSPAPQSPAPKEFERAPVANSIIGSESKISTDVEQEAAVIDNSVDAPTDSSASPLAEPQSRSAERKESVTDRHQKSQQASRECISVADMESQIAEAKTEVLTEPEHQTLPPISIRSSIMQLSTASTSAVRKSAVGDASRAAQENDASELPIPCDGTATAAYLPHISPICKAVQCATIDSAACSPEKRSSRGVVLPLLVAAPAAAELTAGTSTRVRLAHLGIVLPHLASPNQRRRRRKEQQQQKQERWQREESMRRRAAGDTTARMSKQFTLAQQRVPGFRVLDRDGRVGYEIAPMAALGWLDLIAGRMVPPRVNFGSGPRSKDGFVMGRRQR